MVSPAETGRRLSLTKAQLREERGAALLAFLKTVVADGRLSKAEFHGLNEWLQANSESDVPAIGHLSEIVRQILEDGKVTPDERLELQLAIEKVLPVTERSFAKEARETAERALDGPKLTKADLQQMADATAEGLSEGVRDWRRDPMTERQRDYIAALGGSIQGTATKGEASDLISKLLGEKPPTNRQLMAMRFWGKVQSAGEGPAEISDWLDEFYRVDPHRKTAWELYKEEAEDDGQQGNPNRVQFGIGPTYLARVKAGGDDAKPRFRAKPQPRPSAGGFYAIAILTVCGVLATAFVWRSGPTQPPPSTNAANTSDVKQKEDNLPQPLASRVVDLDPPQSNAVFVEALKVSGIIVGKRTRVMIDGKFYFVGDVIDLPRGVLLHSIDAKTSIVKFMDTKGEIYTKVLN
jgi:hypothetical protein